MYPLHNVRVELNSPLSNLGPVDGSQISDKEPAQLVVS